ncbi:hypothetical protein ACVW00_002740 [Marmoricola sp. URHA0025 HA25]
MSHLRRLGALVAAGALTVTGLTLVGGPAQAATADPRPVTIGATWLEGQLSSGIFNGDCSYDCGSTLDAGFALDAAGEDAAVGTVADAVGPKIAQGYAVADEYDFNPPYDFKQVGIYAGALAKSIVFAQTAGVADLGAWSGRDLLADLEARVSSTAGIVGRITDDSFYGNYANNIGQAFAVAALHTAGATAEADDALHFLLTQQCAAGYFRLSPARLDAADPGQTCDEGRASGDSPADPDVTSTVVRMLLPQIDTSAAAARAIGKAEAWLLADQHADGSFGGGTSTSGENANSTGLAGWALGALGDTDAATAAAVWVRQHQADELGSCPDGLSTQPGAIGYDDATLATGRASGISSATSDQWRRATAQALPALAYAPAGTQNLTLAGPTGYVQAGTMVTYRVHGAVPGDKVCLTGVGSATPAAAGLDGSAAVALKLPAGTADLTATVSGRGAGTASVRTSVLGATTLTVTPARSTKHRGSRLRVTVTGLAPGERVQLLFRGTAVRTGIADSAGRFVRSLRVGHKLGKARIVAQGEFPTIRHGRVVVRVVR